jgi:hypothetical protein
MIEEAAKPAVVVVFASGHELTIVRKPNDGVFVQAFENRWREANQLINPLHHDGAVAIRHQRLAGLPRHRCIAVFVNVDCRG